MLLDAELWNSFLENWPPDELIELTIEQSWDPLRTLWGPVSGWLCCVVGNVAQKLEWNCQWSDCSFISWCPPAFINLSSVIHSFVCSFCMCLFAYMLVNKSPCGLSALSCSLSLPKRCLFFIRHGLIFSYPTLHGIVIPVTINVQVNLPPWFRSWLCIDLAVFSGFWL